jgi:hypothetical protein
MHLAGSTQTRPDRNEYVTINEVILKTERAQFRIKTIEGVRCSAAEYRGYDYGIHALSQKAGSRTVRTRLQKTPASGMS